jgi:hypothetical protein
VESGGTDLDARSRFDVWQQFADAGIPREGGMADLRAAAASDNPPFSAVICGYLREHLNGPGVTHSTR